LTEMAVLQDLHDSQFRFYKIYTTHSFHHPGVTSSKLPPPRKKEKYSETLSMHVLLLHDHTPSFTSIKTGKSIFVYSILYTDMCRLTKEIRSEKCVVRRFRRRANVIECTYTNLDSIAF